MYGPDSQPTNKLVCPTVGHKDLYVELDYMIGHSPDTAAIKDVIMAFGNAPITGQTADGLARTTGIALHVKVDESLTHVTQINVWTDGDADVNNDLAHIKEGSAASLPCNKIDRFHSWHLYIISLKFWRIFVVVHSKKWEG